MIILLTTVYQCYQYLIRETDLHKFDNLFLNPIEHCKYMYIELLYTEISLNKYCLN